MLQLLNWACGAEKLGVLDIKETVMILATDERAYDQAVALGFHALHPRMLDWATYEVPNVTKQGAEHTRMCIKCTLGYTTPMGAV